MTERWRQLPLDRATTRMPLLRALLDDLAGDLAPVSDLGPAVVMDQLTVLVHDACASSRSTRELAIRLADLRRALTHDGP